MKCVALRDGVIAAICNGFTILEIEGDSKEIIDCYNRRSNSLGSIILLIANIWRLSQDLNIYNCCHIYKATNRTTDCLSKKDIYNTNHNIWCSDFPMNVIKFGFEDYCGSSFNHMFKFPYSYSLFFQQKKKTNKKTLANLFIDQSNS